MEQGPDACGTHGLRAQQSTSLETDDEDDVPPDERHPRRILRTASDWQPDERPPVRPKWSGKVITITRYLRHALDLIWCDGINVLLIFVPIGIVVGFYDVDPGAVFVLNALGIIPLAVVISTATESLASRLGDTLGALLNVTVGNTAELMIFFAALGKNQIRIVQASLLGSILANLLLVLGTAMLCGGLRFKKRLEDKVASRMSIGLLDLGLTVAMLPVAMFAFLHDSESKATIDVLTLSRGISIGLICVYVVYIYFQMRYQTKDLSLSSQKEGPDYVPLSDLEPESSVRDFAYSHTKRSTSPEHHQTRSIVNGPSQDHGRTHQMPSFNPSVALPPSPPASPLSISSRSETLSPTRSSIDESVTHESSSSYDSGFLDHSNKLEDNDQSVEMGPALYSETVQYNRKRQTPLLVAIVVLLISTGLVSISTELAVDAIPAIVESWRISEIFLGFIVLPIVGNAAEHVAATKLAIRNKMVLAKSVAVESSTQVVLFITPAIVLLGWFRGRGMSMQFDVFEIACIATSAMIVSLVICHGKSDYRQGAMLLSIYSIFAFTSLFYRGDPYRRQ